MRKIAREPGKRSQSLLVCCSCSQLSPNRGHATYLSSVMQTLVS